MHQALSLTVLNPLSRALLNNTGPILHTGLIGRIAQAAEGLGRRLSTLRRLLLLLRLLSRMQAHLPQFCRRHPQQRIAALEQIENLPFSRVYS